MPPERPLTMTVVLAGLLLVLLTHVAALWTLHEDAFISFRYARHFADGHGLRWNVDEAPVEGYTNFLWVALMSAARRAGLDMVPVSQWLGTALACGALVVTARLARRLYPTGAVWVLPPLLLALSGSFAAWASSGMETLLFTFLLVVAVAREVAEREDSRRWPLSSFTLALAAMTRPEGALVFALVLAHRLADPPEGRRDLRELARWSLAFVVLFGAYFLWRYQYYGFLLPNTFYAKVGSSLEQVERGLKYVGKFFVVMGVPLLALPGFVLGWRIRLVSLAATITLPFLVYIAAVGGDYMALFRFMVPLLPFIALVVPRPILAIARDTRRPTAVWAAATAVLIVGSLVPSLNLEGLPRDPPPSGPYLRSHRPDHWYLKMRQVTAYPRLIAERWYVNRFHLLGRWMQRELPPEASVAYYGVGVIGYVCQRSILDMWGLNDTHIAHLRPATIGTGLAGHDKRDLLYVLGREPTYILYSRHFSPTPRGAEQLPAMYLAELSELPPAALPRVLDGLGRYAVENVWLTDARNHEAGYITLLRLTRCSTPEGCRRCPRCARASPQPQGLRRHSRRSNWFVDAQ
jgi:arabinofuranosyltransferase